MKGYIEGMIYNIGPYQNRDYYLEKTVKLLKEQNNSSVKF